MMQVRCELKGERISVTWDRRFPGDNDMAKAVPGYRWIPELRVWSYPLSMTTCRLLREVYTDMLVIGPRLARWARSEQERGLRMGRLSAAKDAPLSRLADAAPDLYAATADRRYQRAGIRWLAENGRGALIADESGLGKTVQILGAIAELGLDHGRHLVIAPKSSLYSTWASEIHRWTPWHAFWMPEGRAKREAMMALFNGDEYEGPRFLIVNFNMLQIQMKPWCRKCELWGQTKAEQRASERSGEIYWPMEHYTEAHNTKPKVFKQPWPELFEQEWNSITIDEAHLSLLGVRNLNVSEKNTQEGNGLISLRLAKGGMKIGSTGTPIHGHALNFWSTFHWLRPDQYSSKWDFANRYLEVSENYFGKTIGDVDPDREHLLTEELRTIMLRRTKKEVQPDLPDDMYLNHWVEMPDEHRRQYEDLIREGELEMSGGAMTTQGVLAEYTRQKQFAFGAWRAVAGKMVPKVGTSPKEELLLAELAKRGVTGNPKTDYRLGEGFKYIIGSQFTVVLDYLEESLRQAGIKSYKITGDVSSKNRDKAVTAWQQAISEQAVRVLLVNTAAGGTSLTLDAHCDEMFILDETWTYDDQYQLEGRIRNRSVEKRVAVRSYHYVRTIGTIEQEIAESGLSQDEFQKNILDRARGVNVKQRSLE